MSQEYTPVSWQDETTSQQGTLINAERLNQMQTAHHYADGFEEVDEIPTEDPGTSYHKIVYCTEDTTFYRWDGTQWTKDVDDTTAAELAAHEADHDNPHQVTKAQVGLGNCDNTADEDKPVSTATQAALDTKADKATTLAGYGITDAYTKTEADTLLADKADKADVYDKTAADTLLAAKANDNAVVHNTGNETIRGLKTIKADNMAMLALQTARESGEIGALMFQDKDGISKATVQADTDGEINLYPTGGRGAVVYRDLYISSQYGGNGSITADSITAASITGSLTGPASKLGTVDVGTDTKPIKLVGGVPTAVTNDLVSTSGAQTVGGTKTFTTGLVQTSSNLDLHDTTKGYTEGGQRTILADKNGIWFNDNIIGQNGVATFKYDRLRCDDGGGGAITAGLRMILNPNTFTLATFKGNVQDNVVTASVLDGYAPMVRTTGNQEIAGEKTFTSNNTRKKITNYDPTSRPSSYNGIYPPILNDKNDNPIIRHRIDRFTNATNVGWQLYFSNNQGTRKTALLVMGCNHANGACSLSIQTTTGSYISLATWTDTDLIDL